MSNEIIHGLFVTGLRNAHAMENQALSIMSPQVSRIENYPEVAQRLQQHITETEGQIRRIEDILGSLNESHSSLKDAALSFGGMMAALGHSVADDEIIKNSFANYAFETFEMAAYKSLITMAEHGGFAAAKPLLEANLNEEIAMADWLESNLATVTKRFISLNEQNQSAKI
ncbi:MAG TPA: ferritin-like domain-containing protein [Tianweitania sediminis]|jgi:ferritin-like metal-binding protein YciE|nr:ferritin-like domain-containing protein [Tianweitania sediminis]